jgi:hypothetical protein
VTEAELDRRYFTSGPVIHYNPTRVALHRMAPPPADPPAKIPVSHQIGIQPQPKQPRIKRKGLSQRAPKAEGARRFPHERADCTHAAWTRNGKTLKAGQMRVRCSGCGTNRRMSVEAANKLLRGEIPPPAPGSNKGKRLLPAQCGTYRNYRHGCRCAACVNFKRAANNRAYARKVGKLARFVE